MSYCVQHDCRYAAKDCPLCLERYLSGCYLQRSSSTPPAPSPMQANTSSPLSRTSNAASANGAASLSSLTREQALQLLDRYATAAMDRHCRGDEFQPALDAATEACFRAFGIGSESLGYQESQNSGGKIDAADVGTAKQGGSEPPIRLAVDPWQGLGKTWSDK